MEIGSAFISIMPSARGFGPQLNRDMDRSGRQAGNTFGKAFGAVGAAVAALGVGQFFKSAISEASEFEQNVGAIDVVFKNSADSMHKWGKEAARNVGLSQNEYARSATLLGTQLKNGGTSMEDLAGKTNDLIGIGADFSAMFGGTASDAVAAISSALKGERDPIESYGITLNQAKIDAEAAALGFKKVGASFDGVAQQQATLSLISKQGADALGTFKREGETLAAQQQIMSAQWKNMKTSLGTVFLPVLTTAITLFNDQFVPATKAIADAFQMAWDKVSALFGGLSGGQSILEPLRAFFMDQMVPALLGIRDAAVAMYEQMVPIFTAIAAAVMEKWPQIQAVAQQVWTNIKDVIVAALAIIKSGIEIATSAITWIWQNFGGQILSFINGILNAVITTISGAWNVVAGLFKAVAAILEGDWKGAWDAIKQITSGAISLIKGILGALANTIKTAISVAWTAGKGAFKAGIDAVVGFAAGIGGKIEGAIGDLGDILLDAGKAVMDGLMNGLKAGWEIVKDFLADITGWIPDWKGPPERDKVLLYPAGALIMTGLINGLGSKKGALKRTLGSVTNLIESSIMDGSGLSIPRLEGQMERLAKALSKGLLKGKDKISSAMDKIKATIATAVDAAKTSFDGLKGRFDQISGSIIGAFKGNVFAAKETIAQFASGYSFVTQTASQAFARDLSNQTALVDSMQWAFDRLKSWGVGKDFLTDLMGSGNSELILSLASGPQSDALADSKAYGALQNKLNELGFGVATNQVGEQLAVAQKQYDELAAIQANTNDLAGKIAKALNGAAAAAKKKKSKSKK